MKKCTHCKQKLELKYFSRNKLGKDGLGYWCKKCEKQRRRKYYLIKSRKIKENVKKYYKKNREKKIKHFKKYRLKNLKKEKIRHKKYNSSLKGRDSYTNHKFNVSISDMLRWQNYRCAVCQKKENKKSLHVDHNHVTGHVRMLLCNGCNSGTGIKDNIKLLLAKAEYLRSFSP